MRCTVVTDNVVGTVLLYKQNVTHMAEVSLRNICIYDYLRLLSNYMTKINTSFRLNKHSPDMLVVKEDLRCVIVDCRTS